MVPDIHKRYASLLLANTRVQRSSCETLIGCLTNTEKWLAEAVEDNLSNHYDMVGYDSLVQQNAICSLNVEILWSHLL